MARPTFPVQLEKEHWAGFYVKSVVALSHGVAMVQPRLYAPIEVGAGSVAERERERELFVVGWLLFFAAVPIQKERRSVVFSPFPFIWAEYGICQSNLRGENGGRFKGREWQ